MGSENDKRLKDLTRENPYPQQQKPPEEINVMKAQSATNNQRINPYDQMARASSPQKMNSNPIPNNYFNNNQTKTKIRIVKEV